jgi:LPS-assembly lipoprotein
MWWLNRFLPLVALCFLAACGFEPLYGAHQYASAGGGNSPLSAISIDPIPSMLGQQLKAELEDRFNPTGASVRSQYGLAVEIKPTKIPTVIEPDGTISRYNLQLDSSYRLYRKSDNAEMKTGKVTRTTSYNLSNADFSDFIAGNDALHQALVELSEDYRMRLAAYFLSEGKAL